MHDYTMGKIGEYIKENYDPGTMSCQDLKELYCLSKVFVNILKGDYYYNIIEAMEKNSDKKNLEYMEKYIPEMKYYTDIDLNRMYYSKLAEEQSGKSPLARSKYIETKDKDHLQKYVEALTCDMDEMLELADTTDEDKTSLKQWLAQYISKM